MVFQIKTTSLTVIDIHNNQKEVVMADEIIEHIPRGRGYLSDQLQHAAFSISLNIAEGAGLIEE